MLFPTDPIWIVPFYCTPEHSREHHGNEKCYNCYNVTSGCNFDFGVQSPKGAQVPAHSYCSIGNHPGDFSKYRSHESCSCSVLLSLCCHFIFSSCFCLCFRLPLFWWCLRSYDIPWDMLILRVYVITHNHTQKLLTKLQEQISRSWSP